MAGSPYTVSGRPAASAAIQCAITPCPLVARSPGPYTLANRSTTGRTHGQPSTAPSIASFISPYAVSGPTGVRSVYGGCASGA
ncbi:hypothetical protein GCM10023170_030740 [Phytohabitans houttuyneae]